MSKQITEFPDLTIDDIETRVALAKPNGCQLLLYKDARCDMRILDETVGLSKWQRKHYEQKGNLFCSVGIKFEDEWVWKDDCGTESYADKEKGEASDSFKRACFNWGIGRELYTAPFIWVNSEDYTKIKDKDAPKDKFKVSHIVVENKQIIDLMIINVKTKKVVFTLKKQNSKPNKTETTCLSCGKKAKGYQSKDGNAISPSEEIEKLGMCVDCYTKAHKKATS